MNLEGDTLIHIQKLWGDILSSFCQYLLTYKIWTEYKSIKAEHQKYPPFSYQHTHPKLSTAKENHQAFSRSLRVNLVKYETISSSKSTNLNVKLITYLNNNNVFDFLIAVVFFMRYQLGGLGPKSQDLRIHFCPGEGETIPE